MNGTRLRSIREAAGIPRPLVAVHTCRTEASVRGWEAGRNSPPRAALEVMAQLYGCAVDELLEPAEELTA